MMETKMEAAEREDKLLTDMLDVIRFTEAISAKLHRVTDEAKIYQVVAEEFAKSGRYTAGILLLADEGESLRVEAVSMPPSRLEVLEKASGLQAKEYRIKLDKSGIFSQVVKEGKTVHANISDTISEFLPRPIAYLISKTMGYEKQSCIMTPLHKHGRVIGILVMSCTELCQYFVHSVENLALHISTALEFAHKSTQRNRAVQALKRYHDHLGELVEERTAELKTVNEKLLEDIAERERAEEALRESEEKYRTLVEDAPVGIFHTDLKGKVTYVNRKAREVSGYSWEELVGKNGFKLGVFSNEALKLLAKRMRERLMGKPPRTLEIQFKCKDGHLIWVSVEGKLLKEQGKPVGLQVIIRDITERKQAVEALQESEEKYRTLVEDALVGIMNVDLTGKITYVNKTILEATGYSWKEIVGKNAFSLGLISGETAQALKNRLKEKLMGQPPGLLEMQYKRKDGEWIWLQIRGKVLRKGNVPVGIQIIGDDISERKRAEEALRKLEQEKSAILNSTSEHMIYQDAEHRILWTNKAAGDSVALSIEQLVGRRCYEIWPQRDKPCAGCPVAKARETGKPQRAEMTTPDGRVWLVRGYPVREANGDVVGAVEVTLDITERKRAEEALRESEGRFRSIVENSHAGIMILDGAYCFTYVNDELCRMSGYSPEEVIGQDFRQFLDEESKQLVADRYLRRQRGEEVPPRYEFNFVRKDGQKRRVEISSAVIRDSAGEIKTIAQILDITERKQAEEALRESEERYRWLADNVKDAIWLMDLELNFLWFSPSCERLRGYTIEEMKAMPLDKHVTPESFQRAFDMYVKCMDDEKQGNLDPNRFYGGEFEFFCKDGSTFWADCKMSFMRDENGKATAMLFEGSDITERRRAEQALADEVTRRRILVDQSLDGIVVLDVEARVVEANRRFAEMLGYTPEEVRKLHTWDWDKNFPPEKLLEMGRVVDEKGLHLETQHHRKDGSVIDVDISINGTVVAGQKLIFCVCRDVTAQKQAEQALADEATRRRILVDQSRDGIVVLDANGKVYETNKRFAEMIGYSPEEVTRLHVWDWEALAPRERVLEMVRTVGEAGDHFETRHRRKDGTLYDVEISTNGAVVAGQKLVFCVCRDITARKQAEERLRESEERYRALVENSPNLVAVYQDGHFKYVNKSACNKWGWTYEELTSPSSDAVEKVASEGSRNIVREKIVRRLRGEYIPPYEINMKRRDGSEFPVLVYGGVISYEGKPANEYIFVDITERKQAEERSRLLGSVTQQVRDATLVTDLNFNITYVNKAAQDLFGYSAEEMLGKHMDFFNVKIPSPSLKKEIEGCATSPGLWVGTMEKKRKDGSTFLSECHISPLYDNEGKISSYIDVLRDVTELRQAEAALRESEEKYKTLTENATIGIYFSDFKGTFFYGNKKAEEITGYKREELLGKSFLKTKLLDSQGMAKAIKLLALSKLGKATGPDIFVLHRKDGTKRIVEIRTRIITVGGRKVVLGMVEDITERKQAEEALRESQKFSSSLLESSPIPINVVNLDTSVRYANPAFEKLTGFTLAEIAGSKAPHPWWPEGKKKEIVAALKDSVEHGGRRSGNEHNFRKKNGEHFWVTIASAPVMQEGKPVYLIVSLLDVTARKQAEEKEKQLQRELYLAQRLASVGELAAGVAHEINNPLTGVLGFSQRLIRKSKDEGFKRDLEIINSEARRAADVVQNLLTFARRRQPRKEKANINDILQRTLELRAYALQTSNIEVATALAHSLPAIMVDFPQIQEVFLNILLNAEQAMSEAHGRGKLVIKTRRLKDYVRVSFDDDGPGISPRNLDKIFDPFFTTRADRGGTGLGLSACHGIVSEHGGRIYARSKPGEGATFIVELPLSPLETMLKRKT